MKYEYHVETWPGDFKQLTEKLNQWHQRADWEVISVVPLYPSVFDSVVTLRRDIRHMDDTETCRDMGMQYTHPSRHPSRNNAS